MPTNITDADAFTTPVVTIANGEPANQTEKVLTAQALANRTHMLGLRTFGKDTNDEIELPINPLVNLNSRFGFATTDYLWEQTDVTDDGGLLIQVPWLPKQCEILSIGLRTLGSHATAPGTLPRVRLYSQLDNATPVLIGDQSHPGTTYNAAVTFFGAVNVQHLHSGGKRYIVRINGEDGANKAIGLLLLRCYLLVGP